MDLSEIRERVEKATGADRELDALILCALAAPLGAFVAQSKINGNWCIYSGETSSRTPRLWEDRSWFRPDSWLLTASIDTALALVERKLPGWVYSLEKRATLEGNKLPHAIPRSGSDGVWEAWEFVLILNAAEQYRAFSSTAPLAILLALISALQSQAAGREG